MERATAVIVIAVVGALLLTAIVITAVAYHIIKRARRRALQNIGETECYHLLHMNFKGKVTLTFLCSHLCTKQRVWCTMTSLSAGDKQHLSSAPMVSTPSCLLLTAFWYVFKSCYTVPLTYIHGHFKVIYNNNWQYTSLCMW